MPPWQPSAIFFMRAAACIFVLLACWQVRIFSFSHYFLRYAFFYFAILFLACSWVARRWTLREAIRHHAWLFPCLAGLLLLQGCAVWLRAPELGTEAISAVLSVSENIAIQLLYMAVLYQACRIFMGNKTVYPALLWGAGCAFVIICCACALQAASLGFAGFTHPWAQFIASQSTILTKALYPWLEGRWVNGVYDMYHQGTYALTCYRINGIYGEASALAVNVATFFIPLGFGLSFLAGKAKMYGGIIVSLSLLILAGTISLTGLALFVTGTIVFVGGFFWQRQTRRFRLCFLLLLTPVVAALLFSTQLRVQFKTHSSGSSPRLVVTLDTLDLIREYPWLGVGRNNFSHFIVKQKRYVEATDRDPELSAWKKSKNVPTLSDLPGFAAEFGIPVTLFCFAVLLGLWRKLYRMRQSGEDKEFHTAVLAAYSAWLVMAFVAGFGIVGLRNPMFCLPFFVAAAVASGGFGKQKA